MLVKGVPGINLRSISWNLFRMDVARVEYNTSQRWVTLVTMCIWRGQRQKRQRHTGRKSIAMTSQCARWRLKSPASRLFSLVSVNLCRYGFTQCVPHHNDPTHNNRTEFVFLWMSSMFYHRISFNSADRNHSIYVPPIAPICDVQTYINLSPSSAIITVSITACLSPVPRKSFSKPLMTSHQSNPKGTDFNWKKNNRN